MQHRIAPDPQLIEEYAELMADGAQFPEVRVWWDGERYWLSDGFGRVGAAELAEIPAIRAEIRLGAREDALWDSYAANSTHGERRKAAERERVIRLALLHPNSARLSNVEIAKHLHVTEITVRRWRKRLSSSRVEDSVRLVTRKGTTYTLPTGNIGRNRSKRLAKAHRNLPAEVAAMRAEVSEETRRLLNIVDYWARGQLTPHDCAQKLDQSVRSLRGGGTTVRRRAEWR